MWMSSSIPPAVIGSSGHGVSSSHSGRMITIASDSEGTADQRVKDAFFIVEPNQKQLAEIGKELDVRHLRAFIKA